MIFNKTNLGSAFLIKPEFKKDERGFFARTFCEKEFSTHKIANKFVQCNISFNHKKGTLRGMHFQLPPNEEAKLVRCTMGSIYDVIVDVRPDSQTYANWFAVELSAINRNMIYIPAGFAHGFQTLEDNSEVFYQMSEFYKPGSDSGFKYDDPLVKIDWPLDISIVSSKDLHMGYLK